MTVVESCTFLLLASTLLYLLGAILLELQLFFFINVTFLHTN